MIVVKMASAKKYYQLRICGKAFKAWLVSCWSALVVISWW